MSREPRPGWSRRAILAAALTSAAAPVAGCAWSPVRLEGVASVPRPPALSPPEAARTVVAGGARAAIRALTGTDPALLPGDIAGRVGVWVDIHRSHVAALADAPAPTLATTLPGAAVPDALRPADRVQALAGLLHGLGSSAVRAAVTAPGAAPLYCRMGAARQAQAASLRTAAGLPGSAVIWPAGTPATVLQTLLAAEHAVIDGYTSAAAWDRGRRERFVAAVARHEAARDTLAALVTAAGATPVPAAPGYGFPPEAAPGVGSPAERATVLAIAVEAGLTRAAIAAATTFLDPPPDEADAADPVAVDRFGVAAAATATAAQAEVARQAWGGAPQPLPGA